MAGADHVTHRAPEDGPAGILDPDFWADALERAVRAGAGAVLAGLGAEHTRLIPLADWRMSAGLGAGAIVVSMLVSLAAGRLGDRSSASFVRRTRGEQ